MDFILRHWPYKLISSLLTAALMLLAIQIFATSREPLPKTTDGIHLGIPFDYRLKNPESDLKGKVEYVWGASKASIPGTATDAYAPYARDYSRVGTEHTIEWWKANHPDWIAYKCDKVTPAYQFGDANVPLDITNPAVRDYQFAFVSQKLDAGYSGVAWDNVDFTNWGSRCGHYKNGVWTVYGYTGQSNDPKFLGDLVSWSKAMHDKIKTKYPDAEMTGNFSVRADVPFDYFKQVAQNFDVEYDERGVTNEGTANSVDNDWLLKMQSYDYMNSIGHAYVIDGLATKTGPVQADQVQWVLSNYLLSKGDHSFVYVVQNTIYGDFVDRGEYHAPIGQPVAARYQAQGVWMRDFSGGKVMVNPSSTQSVTVTVPAGFTDLYGSQPATLVMKPATGVVLLDKSKIPPGTDPTVRTPEPGTPSAATAPAATPTPCVGVCGPEGGAPNMDIPGAPAPKGGASATSGNASSGAVEKAAASIKGLPKSGQVGLFLVLTVLVFAASYFGLHYWRRRSQPKD